MPFKNVESLKVYVKKLIVNKKYLERRLVCRKKEKNCVKRGYFIILDGLILP
jgi:hypothetical protein